MNPHCLICESSAVISQDNAKAIVQLFMVLNGLAREWQTLQHTTKNPHPVEPKTEFLQTMTAAVANTASALRASDTFIQDIQKYQFGAFTCLCLRCGTRFDAIDP